MNNTSNGWADYISVKKSTEMDNRPKIMLLGGLSYLIPAITEAHKIGASVITSDYLPNNIAHQYSDCYCNVNIIDKEEVLKAAKELQIDGILSFAVDPGVTSAAYVAEQLNLPFQCSYQSACIFQNKDLFRQFLKDNGFNCPKAKGYADIEEAVHDIGHFSMPAVVKPVDSAGSKGVSEVYDAAGMALAAKRAISLSHCKRFIVEEYLESDGRSFDSEVFVRDGKLVFSGCFDQYFDSEAENPFTPVADVYPAIMPRECLDEVNRELQRLFSLLGVRTGLFNVEFRRCKDGKLYLMEVSPRAGGNRLSELLFLATGVNLVEAEIRKSIDLGTDHFYNPEHKGHYAVYNLHSNIEGIFDGIKISEEFSASHLVEENILINEGDAVKPYSGANALFGTLFLRFDSREELDAALEHQSHWLTVNIKKY